MCKAGSSPGDAQVPARRISGAIQSTEPQPVITPVFIAASSIPLSLVSPKSVILISACGSSDERGGGEVSSRFGLFKSRWMIGLLAPDESWKAVCKYCMPSATSVATFLIWNSLGFHRSTYSCLSKAWPSISSCTSIRPSFVA